MAIALIDHTKKETNSAGTTTDPIDTTGADFLVACVSDGTVASGGSAAFTDSYGNTWSEIGNDNGGNRVRILYCVPGVNVGAGHTFSALGASSYATICVAAFSGVKQTSPLDQQNADMLPGGLQGKVLATGSVSPSQGEELLIFGCGHNWTGMLSVDIGTLLDSISGAVNWGISLAYEIQTVATTRNPVFTQTGADQLMNAIIATFKPPGGTFNPVLAAAACSVNGNNTL